MLPTVTIITTVLNERAGLERTIRSIEEQDYPNLEYIVVDGGSTDGTLSVIEGCSRINAWVSGPDRGIADGFNRGLQLAQGEYINFQGAGDYFLAPDVVRRLMQGIQADQVDLVCGQVLRVDEQETPLWVAPKRFNSAFNKKKLWFKMALPHQGLFTHRRFFEQFGQFDLNVRFAMDYELLLRAYHRFPAIVTREIAVSAWRAGGIGTGRLNEIFDEYQLIKLKHAVAPVWLLNYIDRWIRFKSYLKTRLRYVI